MCMRMHESTHIEEYASTKECVLPECAWMCVPLSVSECMSLRLCSTEAISDSGAWSSWHLG